MTEKIIFLFINDTEEKKDFMWEKLMMKLFKERV